MATIRHVLFDADGVLQQIRGGFYTAAEALLGEHARAVLDTASDRERPLLASDEDFLPVLAQVLREQGLDVAANDLYAAVWQNTEPSASSFDLVRRLRAAGYGVHLGTNQVRRRAEYLRTVLGYDELFDVSLYSCDLGVAKPDPGFFEKAATRIGAESAEILFVDDHPANVEGARSTGMAAVHWCLDEGHAVLVDRLAEHGVRPAD
ncbi:HAD-IA family hydrolase [Promicromonospora sp. NPDC050262]|uniref:HAD family hydrolase n=1 Tax=Promicromonospora sp. NPDC050262 TaxID=3155036 RepID=UPI0033E50518